MSLLNHPNFIRYALFADAVASGATGVLVMAGHGFLAPMLNLPEMLLLGAGLVLIPFVAFVLFTAMRRVMSRLAVQAIIEINLLWAVASFGLLFGGWIQPNPFGIAFIAAQGLAVAALGIIQYLGLKAQPRHV